LVDALAVGSRVGSEGTADLGVGRVDEDGVMLGVVVFHVQDALDKTALVDTVARIVRL